MKKPFHLSQWIEENRHLLRPPVGNQQIYVQNEDFIVMIVGGPNARKDYHYNEGEELFYQLEGDIVLNILNEQGLPEAIPIRAGEMFLLPPRVPHSPQRKENTIGLVIERYRRSGEKDGFIWICEKCHNKLHEEYIELTDIVKQLPVVMNNFFGNEALRTCKKCGTMMQPPVKKS